jgi:hypothetical protein
MKKNTSGMTIVEVLVVLGIALVIVALALVMILAAGREGRDVKRLSDMDSLRSSLAAVRVQFGSFAESGCSAGAVAECSDGNLARNLPTIKKFHDPKGVVSCALNCTAVCEYAFSDTPQIDSYSVLFYIEKGAGNVSGAGCYKLTPDGIVKAE